MGKSTIYVYNESNILLSGWWLKNHLETYEFVNVKDDIPYMKWTIKHVVALYQLYIYISMAMQQEPIDWRYLPYIGLCKGYVSTIDVLFPLVG